MHTIRIPITIQSGVFSSEKTVTFETPDMRHSLMVDTRYIKDNYIIGEVIDYNVSRIYIKLPGATVDGLTHMSIDWETASEWEGETASEQEKVTGLW